MTGKKITKKVSSGASEPRMTRSMTRSLRLALKNEDIDAIKTTASSESQEKYEAKPTKSDRGGSAKKDTDGPKKKKKIIFVKKGSATDSAEQNQGPGDSNSNGTPCPFLYCNYKELSSYPKALQTHIESTHSMISCLWCDQAFPRGGDRKDITAHLRRHHHWDLVKEFGINGAKKTRIGGIIYLLLPVGGKRAAADDHAQDDMIRDRKVGTGGYKPPRAGDRMPGEAFEMSGARSPGNGMEGIDVPEVTCTIENDAAVIQAATGDCHADSRTVNGNDQNCTNTAGSGKEAEISGRPGESDLPDYESDLSDSESDEDVNDNPDRQRSLRSLLAENAIQVKDFGATWAEGQEPLRGQSSKTKGETAVMAPDATGQGLHETQQSVRGVKRKHEDSQTDETDARPSKKVRSLSPNVGDLGRRDAPENNVSNVIARASDMAGPVDRGFVEAVKGGCAYYALDLQDIIRESIHS